MKAVVGSFLLLAVVCASAGPAAAQQVTNSGQPDATVVIDGRQIPAPPQAFGGKIEPLAQDSKPFWPARVVPPKGAPNVLLILTDDVGFGAPSTFGGVIPTPTLDRIANDGLRYTNFHTTALCSPTRAALITGRNHHSVGYRRHRRTGHRLPRLRQHHHQGQGDDRRDPEGQWLPHLLVRQEPQHAVLPGVRHRPVRPVADRHGLRVFLRLHGRRHEPVAAGATSPATPPTSIPSRAIRSST